MSPGPLYLALIRIALVEALAGSLMWMAEYSLRRGWRNVVGRNLLAKTAIICGLLLISLLTAFLRFSPAWLDALRWCDLVLVAAIGPVMAWRMIVFRRVGGAVARCPSGHSVSAGARYCPQCGRAVHPEEETRALSPGPGVGSGPGQARAGLHRGRVLHHVRDDDLLRAGCDAGDDSVAVLVQRPQPPDGHRCLYLGLGQAEHGGDVGAGAVQGRGDGGLGGGLAEPGLVVRDREAAVRVNSLAGVELEDIAGRAGCGEPDRLGARDQFREGDRVVDGRHVHRRPGVRQCHACFLTSGGPAWSGRW